MALTRTKKVIRSVEDIFRRYRVTPQQARYIFSEVRKDLNLQIPKAPKVLPDYLSPAEIYRLLEVAGRVPADALLIEFMIFTGLRISEARDLLVQSIDFDNNQLKVVAGKGAKDRYVPLTTNLGHKIKLSLSGRKRGFLFARRDGKRFTTRGLRYRITKHIVKAEFSKKIHTHSLRHTFACLCLSRGMRLEDIKLLLGHTNIKTTEIYAKLELGSVKQQFLSLMDQRG